MAKKAKGSKGGKKPGMNITPPPVKSPKKGVKGGE